MKRADELFEILRKGDTLSDTELVYLRNKFEKMVDACDGFGLLFYTTRSQALRRVAELNGMIQARGGKV